MVTDRNAMSTSLAVGATSVALSPDLYWEDEQSWHPVAQTVDRTLTGAIVVSSAVMLAGRPITLRGFDDGSAWLTQAALAQLKSWAAAPGLVMTLSLAGVAREVIFRHQEGPAIDAEPIVHYSDVAPTDYYRVALRFTEV